MDSSREEQVNKIVNSLKDGFSRVVLFGESGIGKTWLARKVASKICEPAAEGSWCYLVLWLHLNKKYDETSLYQNIGIRLSLFPQYEETEEVGPNEKEEGKTEDLVSLKRKITDEIEDRKTRASHKKMETGENVEKKIEAAAGGHESSSPEEKNFLLLILDDEGSVTSEEEVMEGTILLGDFLKPHQPLKFLITRRKSDESATSHDKELIEKIKPLGDEATQGLLEKESLWEKREHIDKKLISGFVKRRSMGLPAAILVLAKSLYCSKPLSDKLKKILEEASSESESSISLHRCNPVLQLAYELLKNDDTLQVHSAITDCFWHCLDFFQHCGAAYYRDLITNWMLEGYFDPVRSCEKAYQDGYSILMEFINRGILKIQEDNVVVPEVTMNNLIDLRRRGFLGASRLGFAKVFAGDRKKGLGKVTPIDDMIKTVQTKGKADKLSTILVSGSRLRRETPGKFFQKPEMKNLEVLGLFEPTFESLLPSLSKLEHLRVLVIRDYDLLDKIDELAQLKCLQALEVSGATSLKEIPDNFFKFMSQLESLHLSGLPIKSSPSTISQLKELRSLILRDCPELEDLPDIQYLMKLAVIDVRGALSLKTCSDQDKKRNKTKNKNLAALQGLKLLDLSESKIDRLPIFQDSTKFPKLHSLTRLLLHNCSALKRLPMLKPLSGLQILDLSGATSLVEVLEVTFEDKEELKILNLSGTNIIELPYTIRELTNLSELYLRDCPKLEALPSINGLAHLEFFDVSGSTRLEKIEGSFENMSYLRDVNLSRTNVKTIPKLPNRSNLSCSKRIVLADSGPFEDVDWSTIEKKLTSDAPKKASEISEEKQKLGETFVCLCPQKKGDCKEIIHWGNKYKALYLNAEKFVDPIPDKKLPEIHGSIDPNGFPENVKEELAQANFVSFVDNCSTSLSSILTAFQMKSFKGCWLERCKKMETIFTVKNEKHGTAPQVESLDALYISNLPLLKSICSESVGEVFLKQLKKLVLDSCPGIKTLFPASQLPQNLEILSIKFCDQLERVFLGYCELSNLNTLHLVGLPMLSDVEGQLPKLISYTKINCPHVTATKDGLIRGHRKSDKRQEIAEHNEIRAAAEALFDIQ